MGLFYSLLLGSGNCGGVFLIKECLTTVSVVYSSKSSHACTPNLSTENSNHSRELILRGISIASAKTAGNVVRQVKGVCYRLWVSPRIIRCCSRGVRTRTPVFLFFINFPPVCAKLRYYFLGKLQNSGTTFLAI